MSMVGLKDGLKDGIDDGNNDFGLYVDGDNDVGS